MSSNPQQVQAIFLAAVEKPPAERAAHLNRECGGDAELRHRVEALLRAHDEPGSFLDSPPAGVDATLDRPITEKPGTVIGPYKLLQQTGEGGMGVVYMAEQSEPVERRVALKIIKPGMDTRQVVARFEAERRALAMMDHPNIARVLDAGTTESGRPYFVMELVKGIPITQYCDEHHLTPRERLELFLPVCRAVQHAHQKGIIHRDIKPSNVLVAEYDDRAVPKIIDFGVAKAVQQRLTEKTVFTQLGQVVGTVEYMSPEQANLNQLDIDTRSDIYSLGVLLYELLTGATPFDRERLRSAAFEEMMRIIREEEPPRPSLRLSTIDTLPSVAANRHIEPKKLSALVRGELDWIVMKALEKDRARRYETATGLGSDIQRYLNDEPVVACPPSAAYRFGKFARRNRAAIVTTLVVVGALVVGIVGTTWQAIRATKARNRAVTAEQLASERYQGELEARRQVEQQRDRALQAERRAAEQATKAETAAENERQQRAEAEQQKRLAQDQELLARRLLYAAHMNLAREAWDDSNLFRVSEFLERHVPAPKEPDLRSFEWYYLLGLCNQDEMLICHWHSWHKPAFSPDGKTLAVAVYKKAIELWDVERHERTRAFEDTTVEGPLAFSPDGKTLASVSGAGPSDGRPKRVYRVKLWDVATGKHLRSSGEHRHLVRTIAFTPDGNRFVSTDGAPWADPDIPGVIRVWDVTTGESLRELEDHTGSISSVAMSPDGKRLVSVGRNEVCFWNLLTGEPIQDLAVQSRPGDEKTERGSVAWSSEGSLLATNYEGYIVIWDASTGQEVKRFLAPPLVSLAFSPGGKRLASGHCDGTTRLWDVETGKELSAYEDYFKSPCNYVSFSPDGKRIVSVGSRVRVWPGDVPNPIEAFAGTVSQDHGQPGGDRLAISPNGNLLAGMQSPKRVAILDVHSGHVRATMDIGATVHALVFSPDGDCLAVGQSRGLQIWNVQTGKLVRERPSDSAIWTMDFSPNGRLLAVGTEARQVEIRQADTLAKQMTLPSKYVTPLREVAFSPDGKTLAVMTIGEPDCLRFELQIWDVERWHSRASHRGGGQTWSTDLAFSPDGRTLALSEGFLETSFSGHCYGRTQLFDVATGRRLAELRRDEKLQTAVAFSSDGKTLAIANEKGEVTLWDLDTHEERITFGWKGHSIESSAPPPSICSLAFLPDGRTLVSSDATARVWLWQGARQDRVNELEQEGLLRRGAEHLTSSRWQAAIDLYSHLLERDEDLYMGDVMFEREKLLMRRGRALAEQGRWDEAATDFGHATNSDGRDFYAFRAWYELAMARLGKGDKEGYREACADMLSEFGQTDNPLIASFVAWTCALATDAVEDYTPVLACATKAVDAQPKSDQFRNSLGAILYRAGRPEDAIKLLAELDRPVENPDAKEMSALAYTAYFLAMAHRKAGNEEQAREYLNKANARTNGALADQASPPPWNRYATLEILRNEAEELVEITEQDRQRLADKYLARPADKIDEVPKEEATETGAQGAEEIKPTTENADP